MALNLITPRYTAPDVTKSALAGEGIASSQAKTNLAQRSFAEQQRKSLVQEGQADRQLGQADERLGQSERQLAMNLASQMQSMSQKADLHPLQIAQVQESINNQSLSSQLAAQNIILGEEKHNLAMQKGIVDLSNARATNKITSRNLAIQKEQIEQEPILNKYISALTGRGALDPRVPQDPPPPPPTNLSGAAHTRAQNAYNVALDNHRDNLANSKTHTRNAELVTGGWLLPEDINDPRKASIAQDRKTYDRFDKILNPFIGIKGVPNHGSQNANTLREAFTDPLGILDEKGLRANLKAIEVHGAEIYSHTTDSEGKSQTVYRPTQAGGTAGPTLKDVQSLAESIHENRNNEDAPFSDSYNEARDILSPPSQAGTGGATGGSKKLPTNSQVNDVVQYMFALSRGDKDVEVRKDEHGKEHLIDDEFNWKWYDPVGILSGFDPKAKDKSREYLKKLEDSGVNVNSFMGQPTSSPKVEGKIYWDFHDAGGGATQFEIWTYDSAGNWVPIFKNALTSGKTNLKK